MNPSRDKAKGLSRVGDRRKGSAMDRPGRGAPPKPQNVMKAGREKRDINKKMSNGRVQHSSRTHL